MDHPRRRLLPQRPDGPRQRPGPRHRGPGPPRRRSRQRPGQGRRRHQGHLHGDAHHPRPARRAAEARYPTCGVKGCANDRFLQLDHVTPVEEKGRTEDDNRWRICTFHHDKKTYCGWNVVGTTHNWDLVPPDNNPDPP